MAKSDDDVVYVSGVFVAGFQFIPAPNFFSRKCTPSGPD
jgi:hypothetical protein